MAVFLDTSALMKLYVPETGSSWLKNFVSGQPAAISELALVESATTLGRLYKSGVYTKDYASNLYYQIWSQRRLYEVIMLELKKLRPIAVTLTFNTSTTSRIRALDAIQLASAIHAQRAVFAPGTPVVFVSSDAQLLRVAQEQGFVTENPEDYP